MEPGQNTVLPEVAATAETAYAMPAGVEATPIAEVVPSSPAQSPVILNEEKDLGILRQAQNDKVELEPTATEVADATSSNILAADRDWVGKVKDVMRDDSGQPYKEEEDAEGLNESYMKSRFNVDVDAPIEEK